ncbi:hypothetical protein GF361_02680 [Candidatus Woesearchaeota archaeon]|nr:hypothetical protein [Candidatus Woesearchaeota archaeon]
MKNKIILILMLVLLSCSAYAAHNPDFQEGFTFTSWWYNDYYSSAASDSLDKLDVIGTDYIAVLVTQYMDDITSTDIYSDGTKTPSDGSIVQAIEKAHSRGMKVMLKPHIDVKTGDWRGDINPSNWNTWFNNYAAFINHYADIAEANGVEIFVVGTELKSSASRLSDWQNVISGIKAKYNGSTVYAANWDNYDNVNFWNDLDYIGVNAYFPLTGKTNPTLAELKSAWTVHKNSLSSFSASKGKNIIFTEIGYQSIDGTNMHPWWSSGIDDEDEQADCYRAALEEFWDEDWLEGMYWWHWYYNYNQDYDDFGVYGKPARDVVEEFYIGCEENWIVQYGSCLANDTQLKYYIDQNSCGTTDDLPADNGTYVACDYCTPNMVFTNWTDWENGGNCLMNDSQKQNRSRVEYDENYCGEIENVTHWESQYVACDYCVPDWQAYNTSCVDGNLTQYYEDDNGCYGITGLGSDLDEQPANQTLSCGSGECNLSSDCGTDSYVGGKYCDGDNVMEVYRTYNCADPGKSNSSCSYSEQEFLRDTCEDGCLNGICKVPSRECIIPYEGMVITEDTTLCTDNYYFNDGLNISANNIALDCNDSLIQGDFSGYGITIDGVEGTVIKNCEIKGFKNAVRNSGNVRLKLFDNELYGSITGIGSDSTISGNKIFTGGSATFDGVDVNQASNVTISNNRIVGSDHIIYLNRVYNSKIIDNIIVEYGQSWTRTISMDGVGNILIKNNTFPYRGGYGAYCWYSCSDVDIINNRWYEHDEESEGCFDSDVDGICDDPFNLGAGFSDDYPIAQPLTCYTNSDCWKENGWTGNEYCSDGDVYQDYRRYRCYNPGTYDSYCSYTDMPKIKSECENGCSDGICLSEDCACSDDDDCGNDGYVGNSYCSGDDVYRVYRKWDCHNPGTNEAYCSYDDDERMIEGCTNCMNGNCVEGCSIDSDCGSNVWIGSPYCSGDDVWQVYGIWNCNAGTCEYSENDELKESCINCLNSVCVNDYGESSKESDIRVTGLVVQYPQNPAAGSTVVFAFNLKNTGKVDVEAEWKLDTGEEVIRGYNELKPGEARIIGRKTKYSAAGSYAVKIIADPNEEVDESDESNNEKEIVVEVS